jgi:hypothetical protein
MVSNAAEVAAGPLVEKFAASFGRWLGYVGVLLGVVVVGAAVVSHPLDHWRVIGIGFAIGALSWVVLIRPAVALQEHGVLLRNMLRDSFVPSSRIERCRSGQTLLIRTDEQIFHGLGVSRSARTILRAQRGPMQGMFSMFGGMTGGFGAGGGQGDRPPEPAHHFANEEQTGSTYEVYIETRIERAAQEAKPDDRTPVVAWASPPVAALVVAVLCVVALFL